MGSAAFYDHSIIELGNDQVTGSFGWSLVESLKSDKETITRKIILEKETSVSYEVTLEKNSSLKYATSQGFKASVGVEYGEASASAEVSSEAVQELVSSITSTVKSKNDYVFKSTDEIEVVVPPGGTSRYLQVPQCVVLASQACCWPNLCQAVFTLPGSLCKTIAYKAMPYGEDAPAPITVTLPVKTLVDLSPAKLVIQQLGGTQPRDDNLEEWGKIIDVIGRNLGQSVDKQIDVLIDTFTTIEPKVKSREEWAYIRQQCVYFRNSLSGHDRILERIKAFFHVLNGIRPRESNKLEWDAIRRATRHDWLWE